MSIDMLPVVIIRQTSLLLRLLPTDEKPSMSIDMVAVVTVKTGICPVKTPTISKHEMYFSGTTSEYSARERKLLEVGT